MIFTDALDNLILYPSAQNLALVIAAIILGAAVAFYVGLGLAELATWLWRGARIMWSEGRRVWRGKGGSN